VKLQFITATPLNVEQGSGTYTGIATLARALRQLGTAVDFVTPSRKLPWFTAERLWFNEQIRFNPVPCDVRVGFDMDGYRLAGRDGVPHVAAIKGVIAEEMRFERGSTRWAMSLQAACERIHVRRADAVLTTSAHSARMLQQCYGLDRTPSIVPELIDAERWQRLLASAARECRRAPFTVLCVCRFYPRKRLAILLRAAAVLRSEMAGLEVRIVGGGPEAPKLWQLAEKLELEDTVRWLGHLPQAELAREYRNADVFCLPSAQEGFGIVFLEAMVAGLPIVACRAAAVPEAVPHGLLAEPDDPVSLAHALRQLYRDRSLRRFLAGRGIEAVREYNAPIVARKFLAEIERALNTGAATRAAASSTGGESTAIGPGTRGSQLRSPSAPAPCPPGHRRSSGSAAGSAGHTVAPPRTRSQSPE
jgi:glycosyltransferase involved in cell wall biosynthesis